MLNKVTGKGPFAASFYNLRGAQHRLWIMLTITSIAYISFLLASVFPLYHHPIYLLDFHSWSSRQIIRITNHFYLPDDLALHTNHQLSEHITNFWIFIVSVAGLYIAYSISAFIVYRYSIKASASWPLLFIFIITLIAGYVYVYTPGTLSEDIYLYINYGRNLAVHHGNPYFDPPATFPQDPTYQFVYWKHIVSVYGPLWIIVSAALSRISNTEPESYFLAFRLFAYTIHLLNIILIAAILRTLGKSSRIIIVGTLLYAWNPLILFESCLGGHNDIFMTMFLLAGILFGAQAEQRQHTRFIAYIPALIAFTLAVLVKLTAFPIIILFIMLLICRQLKQGTRPNMRSTISIGLQASGVCIIIACLLYGPFWFGHPLQAIYYSFSSQPPNGHAFNSLLAALQIWQHAYPLSTFTRAIPHLLLTYNLWSSITLLLLIVSFIIGTLRLRQKPTIETLILTTLAPLGAFLLTTNWFLPWYVTMLVSLAALAWPPQDDRSARALLAFTFTLSASAFLAYYYNFIGTYYIHSEIAQSWRLAVAYMLQFILPLLTSMAFLTNRFPVRQPRVVE